MTYKIVRYEDYDEIVDESGVVLDVIDHPVTYPDDIIKTILNDMGVENQQKEALYTLFTGDWELIDDEL